MVAFRLLPLARDFLAATLALLSVALVLVLRLLVVSFSASYAALFSALFLKRALARLISILQLRQKRCAVIICFRMVSKAPLKSLQ